MKRFWKIARYSLLTILLLLVLIWLAIQTPPVQNWLARQVTARLSKNLRTTVSVKRVSFSLFNRMLLEGALVEDRNRDTLLYAGTAELRITDWFFLKNHVELKYIGLKDAQINFQRSDSVWNFQFLVDYFSSPTEVKSNKTIDFNFRTIDLQNVALIKKDGWIGENQILRIGALKMDPQEIDFNKNIAHIRSIDLTKPQFFLYKYPGNMPDSPPDTTVEIIVNDPKHLRWNAVNWDIRIDNLAINDGVFKNDQKDDRDPYPWFDGDHFLFTGVNASFKNVHLFRDTITAQIKIKAREKSGFEVQSLAANVRVDPELMEFNNLDVKTNKSHVRNYFSMQYKSFDDMSDFISQIRLEGRFDHASISSDDIAFFTPVAKNWNKDISLHGTVKGSVDDMHGKNLVVQAGKNTVLNGDISLTGLPDISGTYIDFKANDFKTTYSDAVRLIPGLKKITYPHLNQIEYFSFKGNFTGFIKDFVTYGTIQTNLGIITTDLNMKFHKSEPVYSGSASTQQFQLGKFIGDPNFGSLTFKGDINGSGIRLNTINATLKGNISELGYNGYTYHDIDVNGAFNKKLFNGKLIAKDPNLSLTLDGIIDLNNSIPRFNFDAVVEKANLQKIHLTDQNIDFTGKVHSDFSGNNIDDFIGTARLYDASIYKDGKRFSFDSLIVESKIENNNKSLTVLSNEFDVAIAGEYSLEELPDAIQTFLHRYYPAYIPVSDVPMKNENFSFVVTTKNVNEYLSLIDKNLNGFNSSSVSGRINTSENMLDVNADVPEFNYRNISFYDTKLRGRGTNDSLIVETSVGDMYINDSMHFPQIFTRVSSVNDQSLVRIQTTGSKTLNSADIAARVQTIPTGVRIYFDPSTFEINTKQWKIAKDGELVLSRDMVSANGLRIYSGDQEVLVTTVPSETGNTNDININLKKINLGDVTPFVETSNRIEGLFSGLIQIIDPFGKMQISMNGNAEQFRLDNDSIGLIKVNSGYNQTTGRIDLGVTSDNKNFEFDLNGFIAGTDSAGNRSLNLGGHLKNMSITPLKKYLSGVFSDISGYASGDLQLTGPSDDIKWIGRLQMHDAKLKVNYTQVTYTIPTATVDFKDGYIDFGTFPIKDEKNNTAYITKARLGHNDFQNLNFDFSINSNRLLLLNTTPKDNGQFYGGVIGKVNFKLTGPQENMLMSIQAEPVDTSNIWLPSSTGRESSEADFIVWKVYGKEMQAKKSGSETNLNVHLDITANNYATVYVVLDEVNGDAIKANGHGNLEIRAGTNEDFTMIGRYDIDQGNYLFTFQSFLKKPFTLIEGAGNYIQWSGNPYEATIKIDARYEAENVRFSDLNLEGAGLAITSENVRRFRGNVYVIAQLTGSLMRPDISFQIELPQASQLHNDPEAQFVLQRIQNDQNELNKQVSFLLVFNSFGPLSNTGTGNLVGLGFESIVVNSISGFISNQISKQLSKAFEKSLGIKVNFNAQLYSGTNFISNTNSLLNYRSNVTLSFAKSVLNERLTFTVGSALDFGITPEQAAASKFQFLPDVTAEWKIRPDGRLILTFFYRDSYNYIFSGKENRSGISISHRREFDTIGEIFRRKKKKKNPVVPPPVASDSTTVPSGF